MNIFVLDLNPILCATYHVDRHVVKMVLETAQILSTVKQQYGEAAPYRATHKKHPCVLWAGQSVDNYRWLVELGLALGNEYTYRYGKIHKSSLVIASIKEPPTLPAQQLTPFAQAMPIDYQHSDPVLAYRRYYKRDKAHLLAYTNREIPAWWFG